MDRSWMRNTAISCAIACGAMIAGPGVAGTAIASADLFGIDLDILDIFDHKEKKKSDQGAKVAAQQNGGTKRSGGPGHPGPNKAQGPGQGSVSRAAPGQADNAAESANVPGRSSFGGSALGQSPAAAVSGGGGGGGVPTNSNIGRAPNLAPVPTTPSNRGIVIRAEPPAGPAAGPAAAAGPAVPQAPVLAPPVVVPPMPVVVPPLPVAPPGGAPGAPGAPSTNPPTVNLPNSEPPRPDSLPPNAVPESFRIGYADYLRTASTTDLLFAALPGLAGMVLLTAAGGAVGFRQARAAQTLPSPQIARFLP
ncbi:hypothetical protein [Mycolicibacterium sp. XJ870]